MKRGRTAALALVACAACSFSAEAQWEARASMGYHLSAKPDVEDYINANFATPEDRLSTFNAAIEVAGEVGYELDEQTMIGVETSYEYGSFAFPRHFGEYDFTYSILAPSLTAYYYTKGEGYRFKFGGGAGPRIASITETISIETDYASVGYGALLKAEAMTGLGANSFAYIGGDVRYDLPGVPETDDGRRLNPGQKEIEMSALTFGFKLGVAFAL
jgi:hypothetical protein